MILTASLLVHSCPRRSGDGLGADKGSWCSVDAMRPESREPGCTGNMWMVRWYGIGDICVVLVVQRAVGLNANYRALDTQVIPGGSKLFNSPDMLHGQIYSLSALQVRLVDT